MIEVPPLETVPIEVSSARDGVAYRPTLSDIKKPVEHELKAFRKYFRSAMRSEVRLLDQIVQYLLRQKGKRLRPLLVLLSAKACGSIVESTFRAAALVELLHTATLVHDDVVDDAYRRRSVFSINALWKNKVAVLLGDFLLSRGLLLALKYHDYELLQVVSDAVRRMSEGELLQIEKARKLDIDEATYFRIISDKTASLISACTACGAISATDNAETADQMKRFGEKLGLAFQIRDDLFDYGVADVGKPLGIDLQEKKMTLPLIHALKNANNSERREIMRIVRKNRKSKPDIQRVARFVEARGGTEYARARMNDCAAEARSILDDLPPSEAREALIGLVSYTVARTR
ncbi:MAG: polyprenyl synthetase family protein [Bacteroidetes bacterium]|nr:polyprenyl synthetase family protein [Bacteroidota bacterium]